MKKALASSLTLTSTMLAAGAITLGFSAAAFAQQYPAKPVTIVVPFPAGGTVDKVARHVKEGLQSRLGQTVLIDNRAGAGGTIGSAIVARSAPDGYTIGMVFDSFATEQHIYPKLSYRSQDLTGVSYMVRSPNILVVPASSPYKTLQDYVTAAKTPQKVSYASVGAGSSNHLAAELFHEAAGTSGLHTPYKGGGPAITDLLGGHVDSMFASLPLVLQHIESGKLRALAVTSTKRDNRLMSVPAINEVYKGFEVYSWVGMIAPRKAPEAVIQKLAAEIGAVLADPTVAKRLKEGGFEVVAGSPAQMNEMVKNESERWGRVIKSHNIVVE
jgi:tripartite-type tricarboxylate transporter receptor subunit TctC